METDGRSAREELWRRFDAGAIAAEELDARLLLVDRATDAAGVARALGGPTPRRSRRSTRQALIGIGAALAVLAGGGGVWWVASGDDGDPRRPTGNGGFDTTVVVPPPLGLPPPPDCPEFDDALARFESIDATETAANPALLSDPPALPEGYSVADEEDLLPGTDPNVAMSVNAGTPPPEEILARDVVGELLVTMRTFRYASADDAEAAALLVLQQGVCTYDLEGFDVPDRPEITGSVVSGVIPTTAFAGFRLADRRFTVAVVAAGDDDASIEAASVLAGLIAGLELDAARTEPLPG